ncbi:MAG TPA: hypothetical protein VE863_08745 [Pyrinomonadaceae bacterium]|jgi:hypothetical protein|nr:hypothetical protein [Pyrinomonadaceae bacterium]
MSIIDGMQSLDRAQFFNGQRLFAADLQQLESFNREMRWLHNQSMHQPGIGQGFKVIGQKDDREVTISAGYALDSMGREIVLTETEVLPVPPVADNGAGGSAFYYLTVSYPDDTELVPLETREGICLPAGVIRLREHPVFCWVRLNDDQKNPQPVDSQLKLRLKNQLFIVLARVEIFNCKLRQPVTLSQRRSARPSCQPRVACGTAAPTWDYRGTVPLKLQPGLQFTELAMAGTIDTTAAGFAATPTYFGRLAGERTGSGKSGSVNFIYLIEGFVEVAANPAPTPTSFVVIICPLVVINASGGVDVAETVFDKLKVTWFGVEG